MAATKPEGKCVLQPQGTKHINANDNKPNIINLNINKEIDKNTWLVVYRMTVLERGRVHFIWFSWQVPNEKTLKLLLHEAIGTVLMSTVSTLDLNFNPTVNLIGHTSPATFLLA